MRNHPIIVQTPAKIRAVARSLADLHGRDHRVVAIVSPWVRPPNLIKMAW
jgi:aspartate kinase